MENIIFNLAIRICLFSIISCYGQTKQATLNLLDYEAGSKISPTSHESTSDYFIVSKNWTTIEEIHNWIENNFEYDFERAVRLANNSKLKKKIPIYTPEELWIIKKGICVDLSRFAFETIKVVDPSAYVKYLKIEFEPVTIEGSKFVNHWLIAYKEDKNFFFFADSKRPGTNDGPYATIEDFIKNYEKFRARKIISYKLLDSYKKIKKIKKYKTNKQ